MKYIFMIILSALLVSCGAIPFKDGTTFEVNGIKYMVKSVPAIGLVTAVEFYELVTYGDGTQGWIRSTRYFSETNKEDDENDSK